MVTLIGAGLFGRNLREAYKADPGFDAHRVLLAAFDPFLRGYSEPRGREFYRRLLARMTAVPGVQSVTLARRLPLTPSGIAFANVAIDGYAARADEDMRFNYETVGPHYFQTMRIPLVQGRDIDDRDDEHGRRVLVINETMARRFWPGGDAIGRRVKLASDWLEVVGVAKDVKNRRLTETPAPFLYVTLLQDYRSNMILVARAGGHRPRDAGRGRLTRSRHARVRHQDLRGTHRHRAVLAAHGRDALDAVRPARGRVVRGGSLRRDGLHREPTRPRAGHPHRHRRQPARRAAPDPRAGARAFGHRDHHRPDSGVDGDAPLRPLALRRERDRPRHVHRRRARAAHRRRHRGLLPREARDQVDPMVALRLE